MILTTDTIIALSTPPGEGALGVIRLSGPESVAIVASVFRGRDLRTQPANTLHFGRITDVARVLDEVVVSLFRAPHSYTGQDVVEISCHGSAFILQQVIALCVRKGARMARPGEFTLRAFLEGKMDLAQAEAVADLIAGQGGAAHKAAMHNLAGGFSHDLRDMREQLIQFAALIELELDFSQEDVEFADRTRFYELISRLIVATQSLVDSFRLGNVIRNGVRVAIVGKPNAGKSTLLNALLNEERAIVSEIAGTTRDTIEETLNIGGILFRLIDTAGIRDHTTDAIEQQGIARSREAMQKADLVICLFDATQPDTSGLEQLKNELETAGVQYLFVANKADLPRSADAEAALSALAPMRISARDRENIHLLRDRLYELAAGNSLNTEGTIITNTRHLAALQQVLTTLHDIRTGLDTHLSGDFLALDIRRCLSFLGDITGQVTTEDKLDYIFSKFCIGK
jgi:tRNA modification GTPase